MILENPNDKIQCEMQIAKSIDQQLITIYRIIIIFTPEQLLPLFLLLLHCLVGLERNEEIIESFNGSYWQIFEGRKNCQENATFNLNAVIV